MPQDSIRSRICKSFLTCNDPKGIVDCSTVRKQKVEMSKMEKRAMKETVRKKSCESLDSIQREKTGTKRIVDEFDSSSSLQLMEVSRGAQKLNHTIDLWSNEMKYGRKSEQIARDLLEGARDLQESLVILGKLQEASWYMTQVKKEEQMERTGNSLNRFEFHKPRLSIDHSYGNGAEELKNTVRDHLAKQIMSPNKTVAEKTCFPEINTEKPASETASTSSSQSSMVYNTATSSKKKGNDKNLIAKLMGLEFQSQQPQETSHRRFRGEKMMDDQQRPKLCMEMDEAKKQKSVAKGMLKHSAEEMNYYFSHSSNTHSREALTRTAPPIVLLKPLHCQAHVVEEDGASNKKKLTKLKMKEKHHHIPTEKKVEDLSSKKVFGSMGAAEETTFTRINHRKEEENWKPKECVGIIKSKKKVSLSHIPVNQNLHRKEAIDKKVLESQKEKPFLQLTPRDLHIKQLNVGEESLSSPNKNQAVREKVINEVTVIKSEATNFGGKSDDKNPDQTNSPSSLLHTEEKAGGSKSQICDQDWCSDGPESSKNKDRDVAVTGAETSSKSPIPRSPPPPELFRQNANGNSRIWISMDTDYWRNYRKIKEMKIGILGFGWKSEEEGMNELEEVVEDLEKRIFMGLIHEAFT